MPVTLTIRNDKKRRIINRVFEKLQADRPQLVGVSVKIRNRGTNASPRSVSRNTGSIASPQIVKGHWMFAKHSRDVSGMS